MSSSKDPSPLRRGLPNVPPRSIAAVALAMLAGCGGGGGGGAPPPPPAPTVALAAAGTSVEVGTATTLTWSSTDATSCAASGGWSGARATSGSEVTPGLAQTTAFTLTCTGPSGTGSAAITVTARLPPLPTVSLSANATSLPAGGSVTLTWTSTDTTGCSASGGWTGSRPSAGSEATADVCVDAVFGLTCTGRGGSASTEVRVSAAAPAGWPNVRGIKLWMSNNPGALFNEYIGLPPDTQHFELWHDVLLQARRAGANDILFQLSTGVMEYPTDNQYLAASINPPDVSLLALAQDAHSLGLSVTVSFFSHIQNVITGVGGLDRPYPTDRMAWMQQHRSRILEAARLARALDARAMIFMQDETQHLVLDPSLTDQWIQLLHDVRAEFAGAITSVWWTPGHGDSITRVPEAIIHELDYLGIGLFPDLVRAEEPDLPTLCNAYYSDADGTDLVAFLRGLSTRYGKPIWITDKAFHSFKGSSYDEWRIFDSNIPLLPDQELQARLFESFLAIMHREGQGWLEGISFQNFNNLRDGANPWIARFVDGPLSESPQNKLAEAIISDWFNGRRSTGC